MTVPGRRLRRASLPVCDGLAWATGVALATLGRHDGDLTDVDAAGLGAMVIAGVLVQLGLGSAARLYRRWAGFDREVAVLACVVGATGLGLTAVNLALAPTSPVPPTVPPTVPVTAAVVTVVLAGGIRLAARARRTGAVGVDAVSRVIVYGAGGTGEPVLRSITRDSGVAPPAPGVADVCGIDIHALLGRRPIETDVAAVVPALVGRRVLVTGAGGTIGSELCRQIARCDPAELLMLDRDESALHGVQLSVYGTALLDSPDVILADVRDAETVDALFAARRPHVVFHAAALKHLPVLEQYPEEAWKTNVLGTVNVLRAAADHGAETLVNISTDKAADPTSVLGRSKRIGERLVAGTADASARTYLSVRFGNVLGSRGSVLTTFVEQLATGAPVTVTDRQVSRYFMTVSEAVHLVLQAAAHGLRGEVHVLDMGPRVRIVELARELMDVTGIRCDIVYTGLREGEKLHEDLFGTEEDVRTRCHPAVSAVPVPGLSPDVVERLGRRLGARRALEELCIRHVASAADTTAERYGVADPGRPDATAATSVGVRSSRVDTVAAPTAVQP